MVSVADYVRSVYLKLCGKKAEEYLVSVYSTINLHVCWLIMPSIQYQLFSEKKTTFCNHLLPLRQTPWALNCNILLLFRCYSIGSSQFGDKFRRKCSGRSISSKKGFQKSLSAYERSTLVDEREKIQPFLDKQNTNTAQEKMVKC